jgi:hypothetical protein
MCMTYLLLIDTADIDDNDLTYNDLKTRSPAYQKGFCAGKDFLLPGDAKLWDDLQTEPIWENVGNFDEPDFKQPEHPRRHFEWNKLPRDIIDFTPLEIFFMFIPFPFFTMWAKQTNLYHRKNPPNLQKPGSKDRWKETTGAELVRWHGIMIGFCNIKMPRYIFNLSFH